MNTSTVVALVLIVVIIAAGFFWFTQQSTVQPSSQTNTDTQMQMPAAGSDQTNSVSPTTSQTPASVAKTSVSIANFAFSPSAITVKAGETVIWTNNDSIAHTVTSDDGSFDSKNLAPGATYSHTFTAAGTYAYHCTYHSNMHGSVVVQ